jgi:hypothetical protein
MAVLGPTAFGVLLWGSLVGVFCVFVYEVYALLKRPGTAES